MAKRFVESCDLCKKEAELNNNLTLKTNKSKKAGRSYDLCDNCKESLEKALISRERIYGFSDRVPVTKTDTPEIPKSSKEDENTLELPDGSVRIIPSRTYADPTPKSTPDDFSKDLPQVIKDGKPCLHMNRTAARLDEETKKVIQRCRDCDASLPYRSARMKAEELNVKPIQ